MNKSGVFGLTFDIISLSTDILSLCAEYSQDAKSSSADIDLLLKSINTVQTTAKQAHDVFRGPDGQRFMLSESLSEVLNDSHGSLVEIKKKLEPKPSCISSKKLKFGGPKWPYRRKDLEMVVDGLDRQIDAISVALYLNKSHPTVPTLTFVQLCQHLFAVEQKETLARLPVASPAIFNSFEHEHSPVCLAGTRVDVLQEINEWAGDPFAKPLFWLNGMAGTGKTTILRTICYQLKASRRLGASFFFKREDNECGNISKLVSTIASQLAQMHPEVAPYIKAAIDKSPSIYHKTMEDQFSHLISGPLSKINLDFEKASSIVFIIDALDECDDDDDVRVIINLFSYSTGNIDMKVKPKFLISSRPELPIRVGFNAVKGTFQTAILHDIPDSVVRQDITTFLRHELARAKEEFDQTVSDSRQLSPNWPEETEIESLVDVSFPLFSVAATISRFIQNRRCGSPTSQLRKVFEFHPGCRPSDLDKTYMPILNGLVQNLTPTRRSKMIQRFQSVIGPFVNLASPLSTAALGELLGVPKSQINDQLDLLHSVLSVPRTSQQPPRLLHSSFGEFLSDPLKQGTNEFWIDENEIHKAMAANCLRIMEKHLKKNICQLGHAKSQAPPIDGPVLQSSVPPELRYACLYWAHHMQKAEMVIDDNHEIFKFLLEHLSHWVEVLAILKNTQESIQALEVLQSIMDENNSKALFKFVQEALQLVQHHLTTIEATPLQVYFVVDLQLMA